MKIKIATTQYELQTLTDWQAYTRKITIIVAQAKQNEANLIVFPEYFSLELSQWFENNPLSQLQGLQTLLPKFLELFSQLAKHYDIYIQAGTFPEQVAHNQFLNRAYFFSPNGKYDFQDKLFLTRFELDSKLIISGKELKIFDTVFGKMGIAICYDSEFPTLVHHMAYHDAQLILVPSCTETFYGYHRVHISCRARALENQCFVVQSCLVGQFPANEFVDTNLGCAGVFSPIDVGFNKDGIVALSDDPYPHKIIFGELNFSRLTTARQKGQVSNFKDMAKQSTFLTDAIKVSHLK